MALGTLVSRGTGFLRTFVFVYALGDATTANAYNTANTLPNTVYYLMLGGVFTSVVVPMLVRAAKEDPDRGEGYAQRIYSLGVISLLVVTVVATLLAAPIANLYGSDLTQPGEHQLMVTFAYFFIPQIFFYGMDSLLGAILNVRGRFGANMWTPVINNVVVIFVGVLFLVTVKQRHELRHHLRLRHRPARDRHHARHRDPVDLALPRDVARRVQHAADLRLPARGDRRDRPGVGLDVRLCRLPVPR